MTRRVQFNISMDPEVKEGIYKLSAELHMPPSRLIETVFRVMLSDAGKKVEGILEAVFNMMVKQARREKK